MPLIVPQVAITPASAKARLLVCQTAQSLHSLLDSIKLRGHGVEVANISLPISAQLRALLSDVDVVLLDAATSCCDTLETVHALHTAIGTCGLRPRLLCFSNSHRNPQFVLAIEKSGARYVRVASPQMLMEAAELLLVEMSELARHGPCFQIVHRFSQGGCAPGEEVSGALLLNQGEFFQLPLAVVERLVFDFLAQHKRIALDSLQIVSGLTGDWFYRDHAANSGHKQVKRIRRAAVKVSVQRIRKAMASTFAKAGLRFDPYNVLRSCPAEGTNRVLYKLHADIQWRHDVR